MRQILQAFALLLVFVAPATAQVVQYTPSLSALAAYGSSSPFVSPTYTKDVGVYVWNASCPGTPDGYNYVAATGVATGCWQLWGGGASNSTLNDFFLGFGSGNLTLTGTQDVCMGLQSCGALTVPGAAANPQADVCFGYQSCFNMTTGREDVGIGNQALYSYTGNGVGIEDGLNTAIGSLAMFAATTGISNVAIGQKACDALTTANDNVCVGSHSGFGLTTGASNTAIGHQTFENATTTAGDQIAIGESACTFCDYTGITGANVWIGDFSGSGTSGSPDTGFDNTGVGYETGSVVSTGEFLAFFGYQAGLKVTTGNFDTYVGPSAAANATTGQNNTIIGYNAGANISVGGSNIIIGASAGPSTNLSGGLYIGAAIIEGLNTPTISSGFGTSPSISAGTTSAVFEVNVGTGGTAATGVVSLTPPAPHGYVCDATDVTNPASFVEAVLPTSTNTVTIQNYSRTTGLSAAWTASDVIAVKCNGF